MAERVGDYSTLGWDLTAMVADDLCANGIEPTNLSNILDVDHLDERIVGELLGGLAVATRESGIAIAGGEIAELGRRASAAGATGCTSTGAPRPSASCRRASSRSTARPWP